MDGMGGLADGLPAALWTHPIRTVVPTSTVPESATSWPVMHLKSVDLPAPFGPTTPMIADLYRVAQYPPAVPSEHPPSPRWLYGADSTRGSAKAYAQTDQTRLD